MIVRLERGFRSAGYAAAFLAMELTGKKILLYARQLLVPFYKRLKAKRHRGTVVAQRTIRNMEEFATVSGISRPTVSKYFNDPGSVRQSTRDRIEAAIEAHDYRPNIYAMNQNRKLTKNVGIVVPLLADPYFAEIARNLEQRCISAGYSPTLFSAHGDPAQEVEVLSNLRALKPAGGFGPDWSRNGSRCARKVLRGRADADL